jgi:hypothetical protein
MTSMYPSFFILCMKFFPRCPSIPCYKSKSPEIFTMTGISWYMETYKSTTFPPKIKKYEL